MSEQIIEPALPDGVQLVRDAHVVQYWLDGELLHSAEHDSSAQRLVVWAKCIAHWQHAAGVRPLRLRDNVELPAALFAQVLGDMAAAMQKVAQSAQQMAGELEQLELQVQQRQIEEQRGV
jgi:hypothetical protein